MPFTFGCPECSEVFPVLDEARAHLAGAHPGALLPDRWPGSFHGRIPVDRRLFEARCRSCGARQERIGHPPPRLCSDCFRAALRGQR